MTIENILTHLNNIEPFSGLPYWAILVVFFVCFIVIYFYGLRIPLAILRAKKELIEQSKILSILVEQQGNMHNREYKYTWKN